MNNGQVRAGAELKVFGRLGRFLPAQKDVLFCWTYAVLITAAEVVVGYGNVTMGMVMHAGLLAAVLVHASLKNRAKSSEMMLTLVLAPLTRMLSLAMPLGGIPVQYWYAVIGFPILLATVAVARLNGYKAREIGLAFDKITRQLLISPAGVVLGLVEFYIIRPAPLVAPFSWVNAVLSAVILIVFTGFTEELIFRGVMYKAFAEGVNERFSMIFVSYVFASLHITHLKVLDLFFVFAVALLFTWILKRTGSLWGVILAHGTTNIFLYIIWPSII